MFLRRIRVPLRRSFCQGGNKSKRPAPNRKTINEDRAATPKFDSEKYEKFGGGERRTMLFHLGVFVATGTASLWFGATMAMGAGSGPPVILRTFEKSMGLLWHDEDEDKFEDYIRLLADTTWQNDTVKRRVMEDPKYLERAFELVVADIKFETRCHAAKLIENAVQLPETQDIAMERGYHTKLIELLSDSRANLFVKKSASYALCYLTKQEKHHATLVKAGVLEALDGVLKNEHVRRQRTQIDQQRLAVHAYQWHLEGKLELSDSTLALAQQYRDQFEESKDNPFAQLRTSLVENGLLLYAHTMGGGALWGLATSLKDRAPRAVMVQNILRTSLITGLIPAYFVGGCVSLFRYQQRRSDTDQSDFKLWAGSTMVTLWPWFYLLPIVEAAAPLWIGGHVVGFVSFFSYLLYTDNDLLKTDHQLLDEARQMQLQHEEQNKARKLFFKLAAD